MEKEITQVVKEIGGGIMSEEEITTLTQSAIAIAQIALTSFRGELLNKALGISAAIVEYDIELHDKS